MASVQTPINISTLLTPDEFESVGRNKLYNIVTASAAIALLSWSRGEYNETTVRKGFSMAVGQFFGATLVDILQKSGKISTVDGPLGMSIEAFAAATVYGSVSIGAFNYPNINGKQFQEAAIGSILGTVVGGRIGVMTTPSPPASN
jgi:ABC-type phosphate/phosphonate transport system permease subunit